MWQVIDKITVCWLVHESPESWMGAVIDSFVSKGSTGSFGVRERCGLVSPLPKELPISIFCQVFGSGKSRAANVALEKVAYRPSCECHRTVDLKRMPSDVS